MHDIKTLFEITALIIGIIGGAIGLIAGAVKFIKQERKKLKRNKDDGLYYQKGDTENPYCPQCYENDRSKVRVVYGKCAK